MRAMSDDPRLNLSQTDEWTRRALQASVRPDGEYDWLWDYALWRWQWAYDKHKTVEEKASRIVTLALTIATLLWAVYSYASGRVEGVPPLARWLLGAASTCLLGAAISGVLVLNTRTRPSPLSPGDFLDLPDLDPGPSTLRARVAVESERLMQREMAALKPKARGVKIATWALAGALLALTASLWCVLAVATPLKTLSTPPLSASPQSLAAQEPGLGLVRASAPAPQAPDSSRSTSHLHQ